VNKLPSTTTGKAGDHYRIGPVVFAVSFGILLLAAFVFLRPGSFSPGEELISPGAEDIAVSQEDTLYPTSDTLRFDGEPGVVYVYVRVENLTTYEDLEARVGRTSRVSAVGRLLGGGGGDLVVSKEGEERLSVTYGGASGVVKFAVHPGSGVRLPPGDYTVAVYAASGGAGESGVVARKYFVVGSRHG
jgi:hypothetical protein